jgi:hypothetical protein
MDITTRTSSMIYFYEKKSPENSIKVQKSRNEKKAQRILSEEKEKSPTNSNGKTKKKKYINNKCI